MRQRGFTLVEVMVALMILAFLSFFTSQSIQQALKAKSRVQKETDKNSTLRDALKVMERDINYAFNYRSPYVELFNKVQEQRIAKATSAQRKANTPKPASPGDPTPQVPNTTPVDMEAINAKYPKKTDIIVTKFLGEKEKLDFSSLSNIRVSEDEQMDSQAEVGYFVKGCRRRSTQEQSSQCLWRRVANYIDEDIDKGGEETVLLENVDTFELRYLGPNAKDDEWKDFWKSDSSGDANMNGVFPVAVEITVAVVDPDSKSKVLKMTAVAAIRNTNNIEDTAAPGTNQNGGQSGTSTGQ